MYNTTRSNLMRLFFILVFGLGLFPHVAQAKGWKVVKKDEGIVVSERSEPGRDLPSFKGTGLVNASMYRKFWLFFEMGHVVKNG